MTIPEILRAVENQIKTKEERQYFLIHEARYKYILEQINKLTINTVAKPLRILDVGCFPYHLGAALEMMSPHRRPAEEAGAFEVYGISSEHEPIHNKNITICNIETDRFPYKDNFFDIVLCSEVLEHLPQAPLHALHEMYRVLAPRGYVFITAPNATRSINRLKMVLGKNVSYPLFHVIENGGKGSNIYHRHNREYTLKEISTLARHANFSVEIAEHFVSYTPFRRRVKLDSLAIKTGKIANYILMSAWASMRDTLLVVGKK